MSSNHRSTIIQLGSTTFLPRRRQQQRRAAVTTTTETCVLRCMQSRRRIRTANNSSSSRRRNQLVMRDRSSSYWFNVGDIVQVVADDVMKGDGIGSLYGKKGRVVETWEKCDVDPTCCCAEQVDVNMAVRVEFEIDDNNSSNDDDGDRGKFQHYFAEDELEKV
jgi:hypothetical protein